MNNSLKTAAHLAVLGCLLLIAPAWAEDCPPESSTTEAPCTYIVDTTNVESIIPGELPLRRALTLANSDNCPSVIQLEPDESYIIGACFLVDDNENGSGDLDVLGENDLTILGDRTFIAPSQQCVDRQLLDDHSTEGTLRIEGVRFFGGGAVTALPSSASVRLRRETEMVDSAVIFGGRNGIHMSGPEDDLPGPTLTLTGSTVSSNENSGIRLIRADAVLDDVDVENNGDWGVYLGTNVEIRNSRIRGNGAAGIRSTFVRVFGSELDDNGEGIVGLGEVTVENSLIEDNERGGVFCAPCRDGLTIDGTTITGNGGAQSYGGGVVVDGPDVEVSITDSRIAGNTTSLSGGGVAVIGTGTRTVISGSVIFANGAFNTGGAIYVDDEDDASSFLLRLELHRSYVGNNSANGVGGIAVADTSVLLENVTMFRNSSYTGRPSAIEAFGGPFEINSSTIVHNQSTPGAPQIFVSDDGSLGLTASVVDGPLPVCDALAPSSGGYNVVRDESCFGGAVGDLIGPSGLNQFDYVGSPRPVLVPNGASILVGRIPAADCPVATDGRDVSRPQGTGCDTGAAERRNGGIAGLLPVLVWGTIGEDDEETIAGWLQDLSAANGVDFQLLAKGNGSTGDLVRAAGEAALILVPPGSGDAELAELSSVLKTSPAAIVSWDAEALVGLGLGSRAMTTWQSDRGHFGGRGRLTEIPTELAVCDPGLEGKVLARYSEWSDAALCRYDAQTRLADGSEAAGRRIALGLDVELASEAGEQLFKRAVTEAIDEQRGISPTARVPEFKRSVKRVGSHSLREGLLYDLSRRRFD